MAEEIAQAEQNVEEPQVEPQGEAKPETDWKAEARKWEKRAKQSEAAEAELEELKQAQMTEQEKAKARAEKAEAEIARMKAEAERISAAREIAESSGVPRELLEFCSDREGMEKFVDVFNAVKPNKPPIAPSAPTKRILNDGSSEQKSRDIFAALAQEQGF